MGNGAGTTDQRAWLRLSGLTILAACITAIVAYKSLDVSSLHGRLSVPPLYDDVSHFLDAVRWMNAAEGQGILASVWDLLYHHASFATLVAAIGIRLFPASFAGPYLVHAVAVFAFLLWIIWLVWRRPVPRDRGVSGRGGLRAGGVAHGHRGASGSALGPRHWPFRRGHRLPRRA